MGIDTPPASHHWSRSKLGVAVDPLLSALFLAPDCTNRFTGELSTFPALFPNNSLAGAPSHAARALPPPQVRIIRPSTGSSDPTLFLCTKLTPKIPRSGSSDLGSDHPAPSSGKKVLFGRIIQPMGGSSDQRDLTAIRSQNFLVVVGSSGVGSDHPISTDLQCL